MFTLYFFYNIQKYTFIPSFTKCFQIMVAASLGENLGLAMPKRSNDSYLQKNQELCTTCTLSTACQINVVNKQLVPPLN